MQMQYLGYLLSRIPRRPVDAGYEVDIIRDNKSTNGRFHRANSLYVCICVDMYSSTLLYVLIHNWFL